MLLTFNASLQADKVFAGSCTRQGTIIDIWESSVCPSVVLKGAGKEPANAHQQARNPKPWHWKCTVVETPSGNFGETIVFVAMGPQHEGSNGRFHVNWWEDTTCLVAMLFEPLFAGIFTGVAPWYDYVLAVFANCFLAMWLWVKTNGTIFG